MVPVGENSVEARAGGKMKRLRYALGAAVSLYVTVTILSIHITQLTVPIQILLLTVVGYVLLSAGFFLLTLYWGYRAFFEEYPDKHKRPGEE